MSYFTGKFDTIVLGAGHAGCEAALACARMGLDTMCLTMNLDSVGLMPCNPAIGGTSKGHLVREIDALGGEMGLAADDTFIQMRMLNTGKGPAVHSLRAQMDKRRYHERMKITLEREDNLTLFQDECVEIVTKNGKVEAIRCASGAYFKTKSVIVACGVYLKSNILIGNYVKQSGPSGLFGANELSRSLIDNGISLRRFKTGTPARVKKSSLDFSKMDIQYGDIPIPKFSFMTQKNDKEQEVCYLTYTNLKTHKIILDNIHRSAMYSGLISGVGTRYCPSIEDKVTRFADKDRHQIFIEPEGLSTDEMYVQGMSTSLPADVQIDMLRTIEGMENCIITRFGYAIEYDCIDPIQLDLTLQSKKISGLYFAGQINGSSGYEEAAAQGIYAGINCALMLKGKEPFILSRSDAYIGVLVDDLVTKGTNEPYRMMTSRAEYRLLLRQDNADMRLTEKSYNIGLATKERYEKLMNKREQINNAMKILSKHAPNNEEFVNLLKNTGDSEVKTGIKYFDLLKRNGVTYTDILKISDELPVLDDEISEQIELKAHYDGYIAKQLEQVERFKQLEDILLDKDIDYKSIQGLRIEAQQKLNAHKPYNIGQASRISGVSPADISVLLVYIKKMKG